MTGATQHCILIPHYRHVPQLTNFLPLLANAGLPLLLVDDGSGPATVAELQTLLLEHPWASLIERPTNGGKGAATITGLQQAQAQGFTHVILVDADGQHDPDDVARMHTESRQHPAAVLSGNPQFGPDIPPARLYGREVTNVLARIEAGNFGLQDAMCGLRVYPIAATLGLAARVGWRQRMELDTELLVRACWADIEVRFIDTRVVYPEAGASHFRMGPDNVRMTLMHIVLLLSAIVRVPWAMVIKSLQRIAKSLQRDEKS